MFGCDDLTTTPGAMSSGAVRAQHVVQLPEAFRKRLSQRTVRKSGVRSSATGSADGAEGSSLPPIRILDREFLGPLENVVETRIAIVCGSTTTSEGSDRGNTALPIDLPTELSDGHGPPDRTVVFMSVPGAVSMPWVAEVDAVLLSFYPGEQLGPAAVDLLLGEVAPSAKLPITIPKVGGMANFLDRALFSLSLDKSHFLTVYTCIASVYILSVPMTMSCTLYCVQMSTDTEVCRWTVY